MTEEIKIEEALQRAIVAHQSGDTTEADRYYTAILNVQPDHADANHNLGILAMELQRSEIALPLFQKAIDANPAFKQFYLTYIQALASIGQIEKANEVVQQARNNDCPDNDVEDLLQFLEKHSSKTKQITPPTDEVENILNLYKKGDLEDVITQSKKLIEKYPNASDVMNICAAAYANSSQLLEAIKLYKQAIEINPNSAEIYNNLGNALKKIGQHTEAIKNYEKSIELNPNFAEAFNNLGITNIELEKFDKAEKHLFKALEVNGALPHTYSNLGVVMKERGDIKKAIKYFEKSIEIDPDFKNGYDNLLEMLERTNNHSAFNIILETCMQKFSDDIEVYELYKAKSLYRINDCHEAYALSQQIKVQKLSKNHQRSYWSLHGKICEKLGKFDAAFDAFTKMNLLSLESKPSATKDANVFLREKQFYLSKLKSAKPLDPTTIPQRNWSESNVHKPSRLCFLIGFPRSGTTLLDTILRAHPEIVVLEEKPILQKVKSFLKSVTKVNFITEFPDAEIREKAREIYFTELKLLSDEIIEDQLIIDKLPLHIFDLPLINFLFPNASYISMIRHPMDAIISNWKQNYKLNPAMSCTLNMRDTVTLYNLAMSTLEECCKQYNLVIQDLRYEDLVSDMREEISKLTNHLNIAWDDDMLNYRRTALSREIINTPSYQQVTQPLYSSSVGIWTNYGHLLQSEYEDVKTWVTKFRY